MSKFGQLSENERGLVGPLTLRVGSDPGPVNLFRTRSSVE